MQECLYSPSLVIYSGANGVRLCRASAESSRITLKFRKKEKNQYVCNLFRVFLCHSLMYKYIKIQMWKHRMLVRKNSLNTTTVGFQSFLSMKLKLLKQRSTTFFIEAMVCNIATCFLFWHSYFRNQKKHLRMSSSLCSRKKSRMNQEFIFGVVSTFEMLTLYVLS